MKFQQYSGPVQAKGLEDTAFYRHNVLASLNEVGGDPQRFGRSPAEFHEQNRRRLALWPYSMLATSTHDTKRGEDARARLNVLSEIPHEWGAAVWRWSRTNAPNRTRIDGDWAPHRNDEYLFYQALLGVWPPASHTAVCPGTGLWELSLVDPDNRRAVAFPHPRPMLQAMGPLAGAGWPSNGPRGGAGEMVQHWAGGRIKMLINPRAVDLRNRSAALF